MQSLCTPSGHATLATKRALPLTWTGLPPAGSHLLAWRTHSITSSARASSVGGTSRPSAFAVLRLIASSYLVGACTGRSAGFSPLRDAIHVAGGAPVRIDQSERFHRRLGRRQSPRVVGK